MKYYRIIGPDCGRDEDGVFHCVCGHCTELPEAGQDGSYSGDDCRNGGDRRDYGSHKETSKLRLLFRRWGLY